MGVASKLVEPCHPYFAGFLAYGKRKFVENLKFLGALLWKLLIFQFHSAMYILWNLEFMRKRPEAKAKSWWILQKICFITYILYYNLVKKTFLNQCMTPQWPPTYWSPCRTTRTRFRYHHKNILPKMNLNQIFDISGEEARILKEGTSQA